MNGVLVLADGRWTLVDGILALVDGLETVL